MSIRLLIIAMMLGVCVGGEATAQTTIKINPLRTYLRVSNDGGALPALAYRLDTLNLASGNHVLLQQLGGFRPGGGAGDGSRGIIGVFSFGDTLLAGNQPARVKRAIDAGIDVVTGMTFFAPVATDIPQDFAVDSTVVQIPVGATHLFLGAHDSHYSDNSDPNNDFSVRLTRVTPSAVTGRGGAARPATLRLLPPSPNPFNPTTTVDLDLAEAADLTVAVYDLLGRRVRTVADGPMAAGRRTVRVDGEGWATGAYLLHVSARTRSGRTHTATRRLLLAK